MSVAFDFNCAATSRMNADPDENAFARRLFRRRLVEVCLVRWFIHRRGKLVYQPPRVSWFPQGGQGGRATVCAGVGMGETDSLGKP